ncbi:MAG: energy-coupling factor transporter transmembrane protein EcfT [Spirochaetaceae bacterium]|nr:energy-coupling factor transporter transmembrane protein EcfT [Spirochaetaceae bacterium]MCF7948941.1 energy-coupling factor transporter transmembrane protein EcfT [Spirochaetia bacterium]MCF7950905.1 energy-coupling factor transporter transmembrane protein EcfT [Spirochaetaceae bacterium]
MAEIAILHYHPGSSALHRLDPRFKVLLMLGYIAALFAGYWMHYLAVTLLLTTASISAKLHPHSFKRELKVFLFLALIIFTSHFFASLQRGYETALQEGLFLGWRFMLIVWLGILFTAVTEPSELHAVVYWLLRPIPGVPAGRLAAHASLSLVIIPLLLDGVHEIREARKSRGIDHCRNPVKRFRSIMNPLMEKLLMQMEELALALESRSFDESVLHSSLHFRMQDAVYTLLFLLPLLVLQIVYIYF